MMAAKGQDSPWQAKVILTAEPGPSSRPNGRIVRYELMTMRGQPSSQCPNKLRSVNEPTSSYAAFSLSRVLQALQYFGQDMPFSTLPAARASFHSAPHCF